MLGTDRGLGACYTSAMLALSSTLTRNNTFQPAARLLILLAWSFPGQMFLIVRAESLSFSFYRPCFRCHIRAHLVKIFKMWSHGSFCVWYTCLVVSTLCWKDWLSVLNWLCFVSNESSLFGGAVAGLCSVLSVSAAFASTTQTWLLSFKGRSQIGNYIPLLFFFQSWLLKFLFYWEFTS